MGLKSSEYSLFPVFPCPARLEVILAGSQGDSGILKTSAAPGLSHIAFNTLIAPRAIWQSPSLRCWAGLSLPPWLRAEQEHCERGKSIPHAGEGFDAMPGSQTRPLRSLRYPCDVWARKMCSDSCHIPVFQRRDLLAWFGAGAGVSIPAG